MDTSITEREAREALRELRAFLTGLTENSLDSSSAERSLRLLNRYEYLAMNGEYRISLDADLTRGVCDWCWSDQALARLEPLIANLSSKVSLHIDSLQPASDNFL
jgi:hypothetical protein